MKNGLKPAKDNIKQCNRPTNIQILYIIIYSSKGKNGLKPAKDIIKQYSKPTNIQILNIIIKLKITNHSISVLLGQS